MLRKKRFIGIIYFLGEMIFMSCQRESIKQQIFIMQDLLNKSVEKEELISKHVLDMSQKLDKLITKYVKSTVSHS